MLLSVKNLKKYYATQKAVDDISFDIAQGSIFGLLGPNGAGKSTLLRMVTGIFYPDSGQVLFNGEAFDMLKHVGEMGYMPEERGLYKKMKIGEQALYLAQLRGLSRAEAEKRSKDWFARLDMNSWWDKKVEDLSKGMSQKLQFVTTVIHNPKLLILDEPFSGLDPVNANVLKDEIFRLAKEGTTVIFSTHRMEQVEEICDHIILVNQGKKILDGTVKQVRQDFKENVFSITLERAPTALPEGIEVMKQQDNTLVFHLKEGESANGVLQYFIGQGYMVGAFSEILPSLNDIFIRLVQGTAAARAFQEV
ncbi:ABC transporter ATP-binding protein [Taibaiella koreensis]|uniref:ABC transporter ATP-binding protein n=1 Tax=Taibaiella koreensis TaxID=1268548 RepID=UPI001F091D5E|nr:ATP-binding cassette domain-containing protein [Taibaiella koreensis]